MNDLGRWLLGFSAWVFALGVSAELRADPKVPTRRAFVRLPTFISIGGLGPSNGVRSIVEARGTVPSSSDCGARCAGGGTTGHVPKDRAVMAAIATGVAAAGIGVGLVIFLTKHSRADEKTAVPELRLKVSGQKAGCSAVWRF
jgi:hypothetical protein